MKTILLVPDGMADDPLDELDGRTPLEVARTPNFDDLAQRGAVGLVQVTPPDMYPGSDAANMALLGYDPTEYYTGRGPVEAAAIQVPAAPRDAIYRCSMITTDGENLIDYSAGHIATADAIQLLDFGRKLLSRDMKLYPGVQYRHILQWVDGPINLRTEPPHENMNRPLSEVMPRGDGEDRLHQFIWDSYELLANHPYNQQRRDQGKPEANMFWPWGQGRMPQLPSFFRKRGVSGAVVAGVDVIRGLGRLAGLDIVHVPGATGYFDTDYVGKARAALQSLDRHDFAWIHVEAPDEAGHLGSIDEKIKAIECVDKLVLGTLLDGLAKREYPFRLLCAPDHATPIATRGHKGCPVPFLIFDSQAQGVRQSLPFDERLAHEKCPFVDEGYRLIDRLFS